MDVLQALTHVLISPAHLRCTMLFPGLTRAFVSKRQRAPYTAPGTAQDCESAQEAFPAAPPILKQNQTTV